MISPRLKHQLRFWSRFTADRLGLPGRFGGRRYDFSREELESVGYWCKVEAPFDVSEGVVLSDLPLSKDTGYVYDFYSVLKESGAPRDFRFFHYFGDNTENPSVPTFVKSRPIEGPNKNAVLLPLNTIRHATFVSDRIPFEEKKDMVVWRGAVNRPHRLAFLEKTFYLPCCDVGDTGPKQGRAGARYADYERSRLSIQEQLRFKFVLSIEGADVATNLKWIMSSNSVCVMPKPRYETWIMEGRLIPDRHYIEVADDFSDLEDKYEFYLARPELCREISANANRYISRFFDLARQYALGARVVEKYRALCRDGAMPQAEPVGTLAEGAPGQGRSA